MGVAAAWPKKSLSADDIHSSVCWKCLCRLHRKVPAFSLPSALRPARKQPGNAAQPLLEEQQRLGQHRFRSQTLAPADKLRSNMDAAFNGSNTAPRGSAHIRDRTNQQVVRGAQDNFCKDHDPRWQWSEATWTTKGGRRLSTIRLINSLQSRGATPTSPGCSPPSITLRLSSGLTGRRRAGSREETGDTFCVLTNRGARSVTR